MKGSSRWLLVCTMLVVAALFACKKRDPEAVCKHMLELAKKDGKYKDGDEAKERYDKCLEDVEEIKGDLGDEKYAKFADCVMGADDFDTARKDCDPDKFE